MLLSWKDFLLLKEEKENNLDNIEEIADLDIDLRESKRVDFYYLKNDIDRNKVLEMVETVEQYRAFATFVDQIEHFEELECKLIALLNYPAERFDKRTIQKEFEKVLVFDFIDEIEFPWSLKYLDVEPDFFRQIVLANANRGIVIRPMLELSAYSESDITKTVEYLKQINISNIVTATGTISDMIGIKEFKDIQNLFPRKFNIKMVGLHTNSDIEKSLKIVDLVGTSIII